MRKKLFVALIVTGIAFVTTVTGAQDVKSLEKLVKDQAKVIDSLTERVNMLENKKRATVEGMPVTLIDIAPKATWAEKTKIKGDFRYRHELINDERGVRSTRNRHRIRARIGIYSKVNEDIDFGFQLATGSSDPVSTNQTLDNYFTSKDVWVDLAYVNWHPEQVFGLNTKGVDVYAGKIKNPFHTPEKTELIWDGDLRPEGAAIKYKTKLGKLELNFCGGGFWLDERSRDVDTNLWGMQGYFKHPVISDDIKLVGGLSYYDYGSIRGHTLFDGDSFGNTTYVDIMGNTVYRTDFEIFEGFAEVHVKVFDMPVVAYGDWVSNLSTNHDNIGQLYGVTLNKCKDPGSWQLTYNWRRLERDAVFGAFTDSDFRGGGTDGKGHEIGAAYQLAKNTKLATTLFLNRHGIENGYDYTRWQVDLNVKF